MFIRELSEPVSNLTGVGKAARLSYAALGVMTFSDLLNFTPRAYEDRSKVIQIGKQDDSGLVNTFVVVKSSTFFGAKHILKVVVTDIAAPDYERNLSLLCFNRNFLKDVLKPGRKFYLYATVGLNYGELQSSQFEVISFKDDEPPAEFGKILPIYPLSGTLGQKSIRRDVKNVLSRVQRFEDEVPQSLMERYKLMSFDSAIRQIHNPDSIEMSTMARRTLAFGELFYLQMAARRNGVRASYAKGEDKISEVEKRFIDSLSFKLTPDQLKALSEIRIDMSSGCPMNRLLQGDVGSGKTLVAWIAALHAIDSGGQVAFMAPTELLARQHAENAAKLLEPLGIRVSFLTGSVAPKQRAPLLEALKNREIDILIGTHALFSRNVEFGNLKFVIIDEQHRFGVQQRLALMNKGQTPDVLLMTATPIPRTLALTMFGDMNVSTINTMPPGRLPIITHLVPEKRRDEMYKAIGVEFSRGHQAYFVYPRIDENPDNAIRDVTTMFEYLKNVYPGIPSALIHSRLDEETKVGILRDFSEGKISYLVSTSVVEVGIDVANATCMVIDHSELFGLAALHQLRGRVGRSSLQSWCFLAFSDNLSDDAKLRLRTLKDTNDGFIIAQRDLDIRGAGEITGMRQSGFFNLKYGNLTSDLTMMQEARNCSDQILESDPGLIDADHAVIKRILALDSDSDDSSSYQISK
ncbi:MAG: ATP-dependent DNA helicase RecG [Sphaerochaetaceae bacterium]|nr:ATP-dependent DNA helicase RecG [Sphaerochaetaceae bacterium]MDD3163228.1 ATP-dependent DNA helicase RecG [Sphaerochaetaceae bacterium]MDD4006693.1 ATP-dependent DNA helicase RecG [Sphaerochaetaceae bacterium]MDD4396358.1 ATP-dependent DNA helicase RecG [Sphaerochaetaceae bacterium]